MKPPRPARDGTDSSRRWSSGLEVHFEYSPACAFALCVLASPSSAQSPGQLFSGSRYPVAPSPTALVAIDFDMDGKRDLIAGSSSAQGLSLLRGVELGDFEPAGGLATPGPIDVLTTGDVDGDGRLDLIALHTALGGISVWLTQASGGFGAPLWIAAGIDPVCMRAACVDGDAHLDFVVANRGNNCVSVYRGDGLGAFALVETVSLGAGMTAGLCVVDLDLDGDADVLATSQVPYPEGGLTVLRGDGSGALAVEPLIPIYGGLDSLDVADMTGDGWPDVVALNFNAGAIAIFPGAAGGVLQAPLIYPFALQAYAQPRDLHLGDFDRDGRIDLMATCSSYGGVFQLRGNGSGGWLSAGLLPGVAGDALAWAAFDLDEFNDIAWVGEYTGDVTVCMHGATASYSYANSFVVGTGAWIGSADLADMNGDGRADLIVADEDKISVSQASATGQLTFLAPPLATPAYQPIVMPVDLDGDGALDLATFDAPAPPALHFVRGDGHGGLANWGAALLNSQPWAMAHGDLDGDGDEDIATTNFPSNELSVLLGDGSGGMSLPIDVSLPIPALEIAVVDVDGDGMLDLAASNGVETWYVPGDGAGGFGAPLRTVIAGFVRRDSWGDLDGDGRVDCIAQDNAGLVSAWINGGAGAFTLGWSAPFTWSADSLRLDDIDGDGRLDVIALLSMVAKVSVCLGDGTGQFGARRDYQDSNISSGLATGDIDGDGRVDWLDHAYAGMHYVLQDHDLPATYCTPTASSLGCNARIAATGVARESGNAPFYIRASNLPSNSFATLFYGTSTASAPFHGATLCVAGPLHRTPAQRTGTSVTDPCAGAASFDFNEFLRGWNDFSLVAGVRVDAQYWCYDAASATGFALSDAIDFTVLP